MFEWKVRHWKNHPCRKFILKLFGKKINVNSPTFSLVNLYETNNLESGIMTCID